MKKLTMTWGRLKPGMWIICPISGLPEQVTMIRPYRMGKVFVRTCRHDHIREGGLAVATPKGTL